MELKHKRYVERIEQLIAEGEALAQSEQPTKKPGIKTKSRVQNKFCTPTTCKINFALRAPAK
jgi:hypothetical protein